MSIPYAAVELAEQIFGSLEHRKVLLLGAGKMSELSAQYLKKSGACEIRVINRTFEHARELAVKLGGMPVAFDQRWQHLVEADIVISSTSCPHIIFNRDEAELLARERNGRPLCLVDIAVPRDIDPAVRSVSGMFLYDMDDLERTVKHNAGERESRPPKRKRLWRRRPANSAASCWPSAWYPPSSPCASGSIRFAGKNWTPIAMSSGLSPGTRNKHSIRATSRVMQRIAGSLARELKEVPEKAEQEQMTAAVQRLFHLDPPDRRVPAPISEVKELVHV